MESKSVRKVDIFNVLRFVIKKWFIVALVGVLFAGIVGGGKYYMYKVQKANELFENAHKVDPLYGSFTIYINNFDNSDNYFNRIDDVIAVLKSYSCVSELIEKEKLNVDYNTMINCIAPVSVGINQLEVSLEGSLIGYNQDTIVDATKNYCDIVMKAFEQYFGEDSLTLIDKPHAKAYALERSITVDEKDVKKITKKTVVKSGIIAGMVGVVIGAVLVVFYMLLSTVLRSKNEVLESFGLSLLGSVKKDGSDKEEFKRVARLLASAKTISAVSITDSEYRSEVAESLSKAMSVNDNKVLLVSVSEDADAKANGLFKYIKGSSKLSELIEKTDRNNLSKLTFTTASTDDIDLFTHERFKALIEELKGQYDSIIFDCPSMKNSSAGISISAACDKVIVIASCGLIKEEEVCKLKRNLKDNSVECYGLVYAD